MALINESFSFVFETGARRCCQQGNAGHDGKFGLVKTLSSVYSVMLIGSPPNMFRKRKAL